MALWQLDIVGGVMIASADGEIVEAKVVTGIDDHSRYCVIASVVARATGRAVCLAFADALRRYGVPGEVLTDNGKQFTARFGRGGEVLFDRICRENGIAHRLTRPASPTTTGKVERFHLSLRREMLDEAGVFVCIEDAQSALDTWVVSYNTSRPHQALDMATPAQRFGAADRAAAEREVLPLRLPASIELVAAVPQPDQIEGLVGANDGELVRASAGPARADYDGGPIEFERIVPASGNLGLAGRQFWLGPSLAGLALTFWADVDVIHLLIAGRRLKTVRSHLSVADLAALAAHGGRQAGPPPLPNGDGSGAIELERLVNRVGLVSLGGVSVTAAEILAGRRVGIRIAGATLAFFDLESRELLRTRPNPLSGRQAALLRGARPAGPPPRPSVAPVTVQRRVGPTGTVTIARQRISLGRPNAGKSVTALVGETSIALEVDGDVRTIARTTSEPVTRFKGSRPRKVRYVV